MDIKEKAVKEHFFIADDIIASGESMLDIAYELKMRGIGREKIEIVSRVKLQDKDDLSVAYTPGVAQPCLEIGEKSIYHTV